ncbi:hypothetical protein CCUS01_13181 [Colletotrichum cuscutae]|uniref:Uncharacterized protein n=1 Tax=Colletotrichum cuscutae TaxID=1209917 RepID=A0AAJ0DPR6_9PEZI|nr:hypothetical protein CCUS01_13181 [Colletotrichum cuscutae]
MTIPILTSMTRERIRSQSRLSEPSESDTDLPKRIPSLDKLPESGTQVNKAKKTMTTVAKAPVGILTPVSAKRNTYGNKQSRLLVLVRSLRGTAADTTSDFFSSPSADGRLTLHIVRVNLILQPVLGCGIKGTCGRLSPALILLRYPWRITPRSTQPWESIGEQVEIGHGGAPENLTFWFLENKSSFSTSFRSSVDEEESLYPASVREGESVYSAVVPVSTGIAKQDQMGDNHPKRLVAGVEDGQTLALGFFVQYGRQYGVQQATATIGDNI